jgi:hypothetical protein
LIPFIAPAVGIVGSSAVAGKFPPQVEVAPNPSKLSGSIIAGIKVVGHVVVVGALAVAKSKALGGAVGAGLGAMAAASVGSDDKVDKDPRAEDLIDEGVTGKMQLVRRGTYVDAGEGTPRIGDGRCSACKRRSGLYCWHR